MLSPRTTNAKQYASGLMDCCNRETHEQMLLLEDLEPLPEMARNESKQTTESCASSKAEIFREVAKRPSGQKVSLIERRNSMNAQTLSKKQTLRPSAFQLNQKANNKMLGLMVKDNGLQHRKQNMGFVQCRSPRQNKTSLRQEKHSDPNRPYLLPFSFMEEFCDSRGNLLNYHQTESSKMSAKNDASLILAFKESNLPTKPGLNLKLGQNLPTYRSEFHNSNDTFTKRSQVI